MPFDVRRSRFASPMVACTHELIYQNLFRDQCQRLGIENDFYPVGSAANHSLLYLLTRIVEENVMERIIEFGSGQTTVLLDRLNRQLSRSVVHQAYEHDAAWHAYLAPRLRDVDYRCQALEVGQHDAISYEHYGNVEQHDFDLLLVDGPVGVSRHSRFGAIETILANRREDFIVVFDDAARRGERETIDFAVSALASKGITVELSYVRALDLQIVLSTEGYRHVRYY